MVQQTLSASWNLSYLDPFSVTNRVRKGGVLSPLLFAVYLGGVGYADNVALLAPSPSAINGLLRECETYALEFGLTFNASQEIQRQIFSTLWCVQVCLPLSFSDSINRFGHILHYTLDDTANVAWVLSNLQKGTLLATCFHWLCH